MHGYVISQEARDFVAAREAEIRRQAQMQSDHEPPPPSALTPGYAEIDAQRDEYGPPPAKD